MSEPTAQRTLVKSPPELWAELSDVASLAKHLGEFGDIRITRIEPETTVAWEGDRASGTVTIEPSGWGTKVTLTATPKDPPAGPKSEPVVDSGRPTTTIDHQLPEPQAEAAEQPEPEPPAPELEAEPEPPAPEPEPVAEAPAPVTANELLAKSGFFARVFGRRKAAAPVADIGGPAAPTPDPAPPTPTPDPLPPTPAPDPEPPTPEPAPPPPPSGPSPVPDPEPSAPAGPDVLPAPTPLRPEPDNDPPAAAEAPLDVESVLVGVLDTLGAAHHRPFSR